MYSNPEQQKKWQLLRNRRYRSEKPLYFTFHAAKSRAKKNGIPFDITLEDLVVPEVCPVLGISLIFSTDNKSANNPSIDKIDNNKGYVKGNVRIISWRANHLKHNITLDEARVFCSNLVPYMEGK